MTTISSIQDKASLLRSALLGNSIFCFLSGLDFALFSRPVAKFLGVSSPTIVFALGFGLIVYALIVLLQSRAQPLSLPFARFAIVADLLWVLGSAVLIFTDLVTLTTAGKWAIAIIADIVLLFAIVQYVGLRRVGNS
jgi:hypothetical protein